MAIDTSKLKTMVMDRVDQEIDRLMPEIEKKIDEALETAFRRRIEGRNGAVTTSTSHAGASHVRTSGRICEVAGCKRPHRSQGYCAPHYQAARKKNWPMPAPHNFRPPPSVDLRKRRRVEEQIANRQHAPQPT